MKTQRARIALLVLVISLLAAACSSGDTDGDVATGSDPDSSQPTPAPLDNATGDNATGGDAEEIDDSNAVALDPVTGSAISDDPLVNATSMSRSLFNIDADQAAAQCLLDEAESRPGLQAAIDAGGGSLATFTEEELIDVTHGVNGCID